jgi:ribosome recycling factor
MVLPAKVMAAGCLLFTGVPREILHMAADDILLDAEERMEKAVEVFRHALTGIRTGRANPGLVDSLKVEVYGSPTPIKALANVGAPEPNQIVVRPFDPGTLKDIEKALHASDLGFNPQSDGRVIRITVPPLSTDVRRKMSSRIKELAEESRVSIRNVRRDANKAADGEKNSGTMTEDDVSSTKDEVQELTKKFETQVGDLAKAKEAEVMED